MASTACPARAGAANPLTADQQERHDRGANAHSRLLAPPPAEIASRAALSPPGQAKIA